MFCRHCGKEIPSDASVKFCPNCGRSFTDAFPSEGAHPTIIRFVKFVVPLDNLFEACISSITNLGININRIDRAGNYIETDVSAKAGAVSNYKSSSLSIRGTNEQPSRLSAIRIAILAENTRYAIDLFNRLIDEVSSRLDQEPISVEEVEGPERPPPVQYQENRPSGSRQVRKVSITLGIIVGLWTVFFVVMIIDLNIRLAQISETASGLGTLFVVRIAPSIEISTLVALLFVVKTILLLVRPKRGTVLGLAIVAVVNLLLTYWVANQVPQILTELFYILVIGIIFNIVVIVYSGAAYRRVS
jgi:hypothetical protein